MGCDTDDPETDAAPSPFDVAEAAPGTWQFVGVEGAVCRGGSPTGLAVRLQERDADGVIIFFEGGSVCFGNECSEPTSFDSLRVDSTFNEEDGILRDERASNPVSDYDFVYVPNCTNDLHSGNRPDALVFPDSTRQQFVGHQNVERYVELLAPYFSDAEEVLVYGVSAGSFGALFNYPAVADAFPQPVHLISDSGPLLKDEGIFRPLFQQLWRDAWNLDPTLPPPSACPDCYGPNGGGLWNLYGYIADTYPEATFGLLSSEEDGVLRGFFGGVNGGDYRQALYELRAALPPAWATYYVPGGEHVFAFEDDSYYGVTVDGTPLTDWIDAVLNEETPRVPDS